MLLVGINCAYFIQRKPIQLIANQATELIQEVNDDLTVQSETLLNSPKDFIFSSIV